jgi:cytoskeletal protein CcmA (bactofilin family)
MFGKKQPPIQSSDAPSTDSTPATDQEKRRFTDRMGMSTTNIGAALTLTGDLKGKENVQLMGTVEGRVDLDATLIVFKEGTVNGNVNVLSIIVEGTIKGDIIAKEKIELRDACKVTGNLQAGSIAISQGAFFQGTVKMGGAKKAEPVTYSEKRTDAANANS